jgi:hypothetical protein
LPPLSGSHARATLFKYEPPPDGSAWEDVTLTVAEGQIGRDDVTRRLQQMLRT